MQYVIRLTFYIGKGFVFTSDKKINRFRNASLFLSAHALTVLIKYKCITFDLKIVPMYWELKPEHHKAFSNQIKI